MQFAAVLFQLIESYDVSPPRASIAARRQNRFPVAVPTPAVVGCVLDTALSRVFSEIQCHVPPIFRSPPQLALYVVLAVAYKSTEPL